MTGSVVVTGVNKWCTSATATAQVRAGRVEQHVRVGKRFAEDRGARPRAGAGLRPGDRGMLDIDGGTGAAYSAGAGPVPAVSVTGTDVGGTRRWEGGETRSDCPCDQWPVAGGGGVLNSPAVEPLDRVHVDVDP